MSGVGTVYLVGSGPGDPKLITVRGVEVLRQADIVLYDRLVNPELLQHTRGECCYAGSEFGIDAAARQEAINRRMISDARLGKTVVRLKGGDPFVFGRGGEEALALAAARIPFEVVPGISSSIAVPASAYIPVTHRGVGAAFGVFTAHKEQGTLSDDTWHAAALLPTSIFLMGVEKLPQIVSNLMLHGKSARTPVAMVSNGTLAEMKVVVGCLGDIVQRAKNIYPPTVIVVGEVVTIRDRLRNLVDRQVGYRGVR